MSTFKFPTDITIDLAVTIIKLRDKFNTNDGQLENYDLDWWYYHKLADRAEHWLEINGVVGTQDEK